MHRFSSKRNILIRHYLGLFTGSVNSIKSSVQFSHSFMTDSLPSLGLQHTRLPCPSPTEMVTFTLAISCLTTQLALIYGPNIPCSYAVLLFTALNLASITSHNHNCVLVLLWLCLFFLSGFISPLISSSIPTDLGNSSFKVLYFCLFIVFMGLSRQGY